MNFKVYKCSTCGQIITKLTNNDKCIKCCDEKMEELIPNNVDASREKHVPVVIVEDNIVKVNVGSINHPMEENHYIEWIALLTDKGFSIKYLKPGEKTNVEFALVDELVLNVYAYCNIHSLWSMK